jgi:hypothetical protein
VTKNKIKKDSPDYQLNINRVNNYHRQAHHTQTTVVPEN